MAAKFSTHTGRGLQLAFFGELVLGLGAVLYFLAGRSGRLAAVAFLVASFLGLLSIRRLWLGRFEFGPEHARRARLGAILFLVAGFLLVAAWLAALTTVLETHRVGDLRPPLLLLGPALVIEALSGAAILWELVGSSRRLWVVGYVALVAAGSVGVVARGLALVGELEARWGAEIATQGIAQSVSQEFFEGALPFLMGLFLLSRFVAGGLVRHSLAEVRTAEAAAGSPESATGPAPSP